MNVTKNAEIVEKEFAYCPYCRRNRLSPDRNRKFEKKYLGKEGLHTLINHPEKAIRNFTQK